MQWKIIRVFPVLAVVAVLLALGPAGCNGDNDSSNSVSSSGLPGGAPTRDQVLRGRYLVTAVGGCGDCHSPNKSPDDPGWLAGFTPGTPGQPFLIGPEQFKTYPANLTPDPTTGLGSWTPQDMFNCLRLGKDKEGRTLAPPMPWPVYRNMTDEDTWAIVAYERSIKPVQNAVPESEGPGNPPDWTSFYLGLKPLPAYPAASENPVP